MHSWETYPAGKLPSRHTTLKERRFNADSMLCAHWIDTFGPVSTSFTRETTFCNVLFVFRTEKEPALNRKNLLQRGPNSFLFRREIKQFLTVASLKVLIPFKLTYLKRKRILFFFAFYFAFTDDSHEMYNPIFWIEIYSMLNVLPTMSKALINNTETFA